MNFIFPEYYLPYVWLAFVVIFILVEVFTFNLTTIWFAFGSLVSMLCAYAKFSMTAQIIIFLSVSIVLAFFARPIAVKYLKVGKSKTNADRLIGETGVVTKVITDLASGLVKVKEQEWTAELISGESIEVGERVEIINIKGVKLLVKKKE